MDLTTMPDDDFYQHKQDVDAEASRRARRADLPDQLAALVRDATDAGITGEDVRATIEEALSDD